MLGLLLKALETLGTDWAEHRMPREVMNLEGSIAVLLGVRELLGSASGLTFEMLQADAPTFVAQHDEVTLRPLQAFAS